MQRLNFPAYEFRIREEGTAFTIFDPVRKKYVALAPEEWVRQHVIQFLVREKKVPATLIKVEASFHLFKTRKRFDIGVFDRNGKALMVVECKGPTVPLSQEVLDQAVRYNMSMKVELLMLTNGFQHFFCRYDLNNSTFCLITDLPDYPFNA
jgi:hypothetical protein